MPSTSTVSLTKAEASVLYDLALAAIKKGSTTGYGTVVLQSAAQKLSSRLGK